MGELSDIEWTTCWMSIRYALGRRSAASASLPVDLLTAYYGRWTSAQRYAILREIRDYRSNYGPSIGDPVIDDIEWTKLEKTLDPYCHVGVSINGSFVSGFLYKEGFYPISSGWVWWERNTYLHVSEFKDDCSLSIGEIVTNFPTIKSIPDVVLTYLHERAVYLLNIDPDNSRIDVLGNDGLRILSCPLCKSLDGRYVFNVVVNKYARKILEVSSERGTQYQHADLIYKMPFIVNIGADACEFDAAWQYERCVFEKESARSFCVLFAIDDDVFKS